MGKLKLDRDMSAVKQKFSEQSRWELRFFFEQRASACHAKRVGVVALLRWPIGLALDRAFRLGTLDGINGGKPASQEKRKHSQHCSSCGTPGKPRFYVVN